MRWECKIQGGTLIVKAFIDKGWHIYSQVQDTDAICVPTSIIVDGEQLWMQEEGNLYVDTIASLDIMQREYRNKVVFKRHLPILPKKVIVRWQACTSEKCLPPTVEMLVIPP